MKMTIGFQADGRAANRRLCQKTSRTARIGNPTLACLAALTPDRENRQRELMPASLCSILMRYSLISGSTSLAKFRSDSCQPR